MTDFRFKKSIKPLVALLLTFFVAASFILITHADDDDYGTTVSESEGDNTSGDTTESQSSAPASTSSTKAERPTHTARTTTQRVSRTGSYRITTSTAKANQTDTTGEGTTSVPDSDIQSTRRSEITGVPNDYNRTSYNAPNPGTSAGSAFTTAETDVPEITQDTLQNSEISIDFGMFDTETGSSDGDESTDTQATSAQPNPAYRKTAAGFAAAAALLTLGGAAFAVWYLKEQKMKEEQKDLYKF